MASSFHSVLHKFESHMQASFSDCALRLTDVYWSALKRDWCATSPGTPDTDTQRELDEHIEWLCSVANDAERMIERSHERHNEDEDELSAALVF